MFGAQHPPARVENPELQQARAKLAHLEHLLKQGRTILEGLRNQLNQARSERDELRGQLDTAVAEKNAAVDAREAALAYLHEKEVALAQLDELRATRDRMSDELRAKDHALTSLGDRFDAAVAEKNAAFDEKEAAFGDLDDLRAARDRMTDELKSKEEALASVEEQLAAAEAELEHLRADADRARTLAREIVEIYKPLSE